MKQYDAPNDEIKPNDKRVLSRDNCHDAVVDNETETALLDKAETLIERMKNDADRLRTAANNIPKSG